MLVIRYRRQGKKNKPTYRIVVAEHSWPINGRFNVELGSYNPHTKVASVKKELAIEWMNKGAKPSNSVARLFEKEKIKHNSVEFVKKNKKTKQEVTEKVAKEVKAAATEETTERSAEVTETAVEESPATEVTAEEPVTEESKPEE